MIINNVCFEKRRGVGSGKLKGCEECLRYKYCKKNEPMPMNNFKGALKLGYGIILEVCDDYEKAFKRGYANRKAWCEKWLRSEQPTVLSQETYDGVALLEALERKCTKKYGKFEDLYGRVQTNNKTRLKLLLNQLKEAKSSQERQEISKKIGKVRTILNG